MRINKDCFLFTTPIAHRGLWNDNIIENSIPAYINAVKHGFAIEIDLYLSKDGVLFSFHDINLKRMTGVDALITDKTFDEIKALNLLGSDLTVPTFDEVLSAVDGKVPLLIEIKDQPDKTCVDKTVNRLKSYKGEFALQSFNPLYIKRIKKLAPTFLRGVLGTEVKQEDKSKLVNFIISKMPLNFLIKPDFISYSFEDLPLKKSKVKNIPVITWTVTDNKTATALTPFVDNIIFEHFIPTK